MNSFSIDEFIVILNCSQKIPRFGKFLLLTLFWEFLWKNCLSSSKIVAINYSQLAYKKKSFLRSVRLKFNFQMIKKRFKLPTWFVFSRNYEKILVAHFWLVRLGRCLMQNFISHYSKYKFFITVTKVAFHGSKEKGRNEKDALQINLCKSKTHHIEYKINL